MRAESIMLAVCVQKNLRTCDRTIPFLTRFKKGEKVRFTELGYTCFNREKVVFTKKDHPHLPVSQIWAFTVLLSTWTLRVANSTPMVLLDSLVICITIVRICICIVRCRSSALLPYRLNSFRVKRASKLVLPTPESPIRTTKTKDCEQKKMNGS